MASILFVCVHRPDRNPSQRFRFEQYISYLESNGYNCRMSYLLNDQDDIIFYSKGNILPKAIIVGKCFIKRVIEVLTYKADIVFVQRESIMLGISLFERIYALKSKLVYDYDDTIWIKQVSKGNQFASFFKNPQKVKEIIKRAKLVITGNSYLNNYALTYNKNSIIIPTTIDTSNNIIKENYEKERICIGWTGSFTTIPYFEQCTGMLLRIKEKYKEQVYFKVIGDDTYLHPELGIKGVKWEKRNELEELEEIDIGIMPLPDDAWTAGKCGLKGLQYMSIGIPTIMSAVGVNTEIIEDGVNGFLAYDDTEWELKLSELIESAEMRKRIGKKGFATVIESYSVEANKQKYLAAMQSLIQ